MPSLFRRACASAAVLAGVSAFAVALPVTAQAATPSGSLVYIKDSNIWVSTPDGTTTRQVTTNGATPTSDGTGDTGFHVPSESDGGLILAYRNQEQNKGQPSEYTQGIIWELNGYGQVIRKFKPPQFNYIPGGSCSPAVLQLPLGLVNAVISPDGKYIAYTAQTYVQTAGCSTVQGYSSWIANVDGSNAHQIERSGGNSASLEIGQFTADSSKLLVDDADFGSVEDFYVNVPGSTVQDWTAQTDLLNTDSAYDQPDVRGSFLATVGFSSIVSRNALRVWNFNGFSSDPGNHCDYQSPVADAGFNDLEWLSRPSLSPDGAAVVWEDSSSSGSVSQTGQGIYTVPTSTIANSCATKSTLLIPGGEDPYWTAAGVTPPPSVLITSHPASVTNSTSASVSFTVAHAGTGLSVTCKLDSGAASPCSSPASFSGLANGSHTLTITAQDSVGASSAAATWRVDTTKPTVTLSAPTAVAALSTSNVRDAWSGSDTGSGIKSYTEQYQTAKYSSGFSSWTTLPGAGSESASTTSDSWTNFSLGYTYCFRIKATDGAGNTGYSNTRCFAVALDDRSAAASSGWTRGTGSSYYKGTVTSTKKLGATLTRTGGVSIKHVGVVAKTCSSCGTVGLYIGSKYLGKINLASSATHYKVIKMLPAISARSGTVTVKVLSSGKTVAIDGVVISRS